MYLVIDVGGTAIKYCYMDQDGGMYDKAQISTNSIHSLEEFIQTIQTIYHSSTYRIEGIALSCPGVIDADKGIIKVVVTIPYLHGVCLVKEISEACDNVKVTIENDGKCAGLAEVWKGNVKDFNDSIVIVFGTGIGSAVIKDKRIHSGHNLFAGEISTIIVDYDVKNKKVIEWSDIASTKALCQMGAKVLGLDKMDGKEFFEYANKGNERILQVLDEAAFQIAIQLYNMQYLYDPGIICIGGGISKQPLFINKIKEAVHKINIETNPLIVPNVEVCKFYNDANLIGALYNFMIR